MIHGCHVLKEINGQERYRIACAAARRSEVVRPPVPQSVPNEWLEGVRGMVRARCVDARGQGGKSLVNQIARLIVEAQLVLRCVSAARRYSSRRCKYSLRISCSLWVVSCSPHTPMWESEVAGCPAEWSDLSERPRQALTDHEGNRLDRCQCGSRYFSRRWVVSISQ